MSRGEPDPTGPLSYSSISDLYDCGEKWAHRKLWGTPESRTGMANVYGSSFHDTVQAAEERGWWDKDPEAMDAFFHMIFNEGLADIPEGIEVRLSGKATQKWPEGDTPDRYRTEIWPKHRDRAISLRLDAAAEGWVSMGTEVQVRDGDKLVGYVDAVFNDGGEPVAVDWKTGASVMGLSTRQLLLYAYLLDISGIPCRRAEFWWLGGASPMTQRIVHTFTDAQLATVPRMIEAASVVRDSGVYAPNPTNLCGWCAYQKDCSFYRSGEAGTSIGAKGVRAVTGEGAVQTPSPDPFKGLD